MTRIQLEAIGLEFEEGGNTIWVHGSGGGTILRIKCSGQITARSCSAPSAHADVIVAGDIEFCLPPEDLDGDDEETLLVRPHDDPGSVH